MTVLRIWKGTVMLLDDSGDEDYEESLPTVLATKEKLPNLLTRREG